MFNVKKIAIILVLQNPEISKVCFIGVSSNDDHFTLVVYNMLLFSNHMACPFLFTGFLTNQNPPILPLRMISETG